MSELQQRAAEIILKRYQEDGIFNTDDKEPLPAELEIAEKIINLCMDAFKSKGSELKTGGINETLWKEIDSHNYRNGYLNAVDDFIKAIESLKEQDNEISNNCK